MSTPPEAEPPLLDLGSAAPREPILVTGLAAAVVLSGAGEVSLPWETRGADLEWGGVYAQGVRLTGPWTVEFHMAGRAWTLAETLERLVAHRWGVESLHAVGPLRLHQELWALPDGPGVVRRLSIAPAQGPELNVTVLSRFEPFLAPVLMEGVKPYTYHLEADGPTLRVRSHGFGAALDSQPRAQRWFVDGRPWNGDRVSGEIRDVRAEHDLTIGTAGAELVWEMRGGLERSFRSIGEDRTTELATTGLRGAERAWRAWLDQAPSMRLPDDPLLENAYRLARGALRSLYTCPDGELTGLVAGYPWYSAVWCRDLAWMLPAVLWMGDHGWAERSIRSVFRFQARTALPILAAEAGELPMQISPGPIFLYGTSDTTLYYPGLVRRLVDHAARPGLAEEFWPALERIDAWAGRRASTPLGLFRNGGEIEEVRGATRGLSRIDYGFDAVDTTIWDSTDRRDHALDVQVLYWDALEALGDLAGRRGDAGSAARWKARADQLSGTLSERYWWPEEGYLYDSLGTDGTPVRRVRPNALRAVSAGLLPPERARAVVGRALEDDLAAPWGLRTLSRKDPGFVPTAYHDGQVWTIATAWAAEAAFAIGDGARGTAWLRCNAQRIVSEHGLANECYRGDRAEPFDSCFLLGFSVAPFLTALFEGLWGLRVGAGGSEVTVDPRFPPEWTAATLDGVRIGEGRLRLDYRDGSLVLGWAGPSPLLVRSGGTRSSIDPGRTVELRVRPSSKPY